jgi:hypothetical protein
MILPFFMDVVAATKRIVFPLERKEKYYNRRRCTSSRKTE